jgi:hypothetical protein
MQGPTSNPQCCKNTPKAKYKHKTVKLKNSKKKKKKKERKKENARQAGGSGVLSYMDYIVRPDLKKQNKKT